MADGPLHPPLTPVKPARVLQPLARLAARAPLQGHRAKPFLQPSPDEEATTDAPDEAT